MNAEGNNQTLALVALAIAITIAASGCQPDGQQQTTPVVEATSQAASPLEVDEINVGPSSGDDGTIGQSQTPTTPIFVAVKTLGMTQGADLQVKLFDLTNGQQAVIQTKRIKTDTPTTTEIILKRDQAWDPGRYLVEVTLDGKLVGQRDIDVVELSADTVLTD